MANNEGRSEIEIIVNYTPDDFFEEKVSWERGNYTIVIEKGRAIARMPAELVDANPDLEASLKKELNVFFLGAQPYRQKPFEFTGGSAYRLFPDGRRSISHWVPLILTVLPAVDDHIYTDREGMVHDPRRERIEAMETLAQLSARHALMNLTVRRMLDSFDASVRYRGNEVVYLYEIWDALMTKFQGERRARKALNISKSDRTRLSNLANKEPLNQGRHRGQHAGELRNATTEELFEARRIAREMIEKYLRFLDKQGSVS